ncbi:import inner membrane translocase subunit tim44 [Cryptococcus deuterogattii 99/473]|uniref:Mitochondrial import inner membrane translocase subunit TIM44 n=2 Tax=Cryptococcus deuterogattii TaxID=1859096 RepID=A0A0D0TQX4_9TREE|nr:import inner membrane translocase subunit tim44 [Cryptococcus deuterogattii R265]KIR28376.1 import inner membrane translocase subunit tim44 [Cryptococcus deuterogattii LA55]KIR37853.1 import inner membrane translocase subunit tim44 [Cryptococcus deuterogattii Ram5]KIR70144.1 import inner membrane translocase subunit tim44 [Cryptococcus deuterogattii CA1014]KIR93859.1 import inner membrane translocase subunit tim44 [Cryptococcus deuterogattii CBS 10090]KIY56733.1 import inner membrane transl
MHSRPVFLRALRLRQQPLPARRFLPPQSLRPISSTARLLDESKKSEQQSQKKKSGNDEPITPRSPWAVFTQVLKEEIEKNKGWQDNVKQLQGDVDKFADSAAMKKAKDVYEKTRLTNLIKNNPRIQSAVGDLHKAGISVHDAVQHALADSEVLKAISAATNRFVSAASSATAPIRDTKAYKLMAESLEEAFEDESGVGSRYGGYEEKEARRKKREMRAKKAGRTAIKRVEENPEAGEALVLSDKPESVSRLAFIKESPTYQRMMENYYESESPFVSAIRTIGTKVGSLFEENETAQVIRAMKALDPNFRMDRWTGELREYIVPEVVDAYLSADRESLKAWCGEATFNVLWATMGQFIKQGLVSDSKILDIKHVDIAHGKMLENNVPVFVITFATQEQLLFRSAKTGKVVVGSEDDVEQCRYAMVITRLESELDNELTGGWKVVEMARRGAKGGL